jgi:hypothetical protein
LSPKSTIAFAFLSQGFHTTAFGKRNKKHKIYKLNDHSENCISNKNVGSSKYLNEN